MAGTAIALGGSYGGLCIDIPGTFVQSNQAIILASVSGGEDTGVRRIVRFHMLRPDDACSTANGSSERKWLRNAYASAGAASRPSALRQHFLELGPEHDPHISHERGRLRGQTTEDLSLRSEGPSAFIPPDWLLREPLRISFEMELRDST